MFCSHILDESAFQVVNGVQVCTKCQNEDSKDLAGESIDERRRNKAARQRSIARQDIVAEEIENRL